MVQQKDFCMIPKYFIVFTCINFYTYGRGGRINKIARSAWYLSAHRCWHSSRETAMLDIAAGLNFAVVLFKIKHISLPGRCSLHWYCVSILMSIWGITSLPPENTHRATFFGNTTLPKSLCASFRNPTCNGSFKKFVPQSQKLFREG